MTTARLTSRLCFVIGCAAPGQNPPAVWFGSYRVRGRGPGTGQGAAGPVPAAVVYDVNVLVTAAAGGNSPFRSWPSPPPVSGNASADCVGVIVDAAEFALWLSPYIITNIDKILAQLLKWPQPQIDAYLRAVVMAAEHSGGGLVADVPRIVHDCPDHEDNLILDLAAEVGALLIVSNDTDLLAMSPWRGTPIIGPAAFAAKVDAMRRHARRRRR
jgi:predicted nucleic acid-binding protein